MRSRATARILVVDDDPLLKEVLAGALADLADAQVWSASNGPQALELAARHQPHLILLDLDLPGMDGVEVCRRLTQVEGLADTQVWILTGMTLTAENAPHLETHCDRLISKPVVFSELVRSIELLELPPLPSLELLSD